MLVFLLAALLSGALAAQERRYELPAEQRTGTIQQIFVVSHSHLDIGFTKPPEQVARDYKDNIDQAIRLARENPDFRWTIESTWMLEEWLRRTEDEALINELGGLLRSGRFSLGAAFGNMHSGLMAAEEMNRLAYSAAAFRRRFEIPVTVAFQNDVPGFSWAYPRVLAGSGVKFLVTGLNLFIGGGNTLGVARNPFYWIGPDGSRVLTFFTYDSYVEAHRWKLGGRFSLEELEATLPRRLAWLERNGYRYDTYLLMASPGDNSDPIGAYRILEKIRAWNQKHPELPMKMATAEDYFDHLIRKYGDRFPEASGDSSGHWEIVKLGCPEATGRLREASAALPAAEAAASLASLLGQTPFPKFDFQEAWRGLLTFYEHTTGCGAGWPGYFSKWETDWNNVINYAWSITTYTNAVQQFDKALLRLAGAEDVSDPPFVRRDDSELRLMVYNGLSWERSGPVVIGRLPSKLRTGPLAAEDVATGQRLAVEDVPGTHRQVLFYARDVPSAGYRVYRIHSGEAPAPPAEIPLEVTWSETGEIRSIRDRRSGREALERDPKHGFGALLVSRNRGALQPEPLPPAKAQASDGPVTRRLRFERPGSALPLVEVTLYRGAPFADFRFDLDLGPLRRTATRHISYAVSLPLAAGRTTYFDGGGFVLRDPEDFLPGGAAPHRMPVHFVHFAGDGGGGVTLANRDAFAMRPDRVWVLASDALETETREEGKQPLDWVEPAGSSRRSFRFRLAFQTAEPWQWKRLGEELILPLRAVRAPSAEIPPEQSFFELSSDHVQLLAFKPAEHRPGWHLIRLQEIGGREASGVRLTSFLRLSGAERATLVEEPGGSPLDLSNLALKPWETLSLLVRATPR